MKKEAGRLHHLISTTHIPGIYNPPYADKPTTLGVDTEINLKTIFKENYRWKPPNKISIQKYKEK